MSKAEHNCEGTRRPSWWRWVRDISVLILILAAVHWWQSRGLAGGSAPPLNGLLTDGSPYQLVPADSPVLVHFWATWCPICRFEEAGIERIASDHEVITVATRSGSAEELTSYLDEQGLAMRVLVDQDGEIARRWGVSGVPASFVLDSRRQISYAGVGYTTEIGLRARLWLAD